MIESVLWNYSEPHIPVKVTITIAEGGANATAKSPHEKNKGVMFKNCAPFSEYISKIFWLHKR